MRSCQLTTWSKCCWWYWARRRRLRQSCIRLVWQLIMAQEGIYASIHQCKNVPYTSSARAIQELRGSQSCTTSISACRVIISSCTWKAMRVHKPLDVCCFGQPEASPWKAPFIDGLSSPDKLPQMSGVEKDSKESNLHLLMGTPDNLSLCGSNLASDKVPRWNSSTP